MCRVLLLKNDVFARKHANLKLTPEYIFYIDLHEFWRQLRAYTLVCDIARIQANILFVYCDIEALYVVNNWSRTPRLHDNLGELNIDYAIREQS